MAFRIQGRVDRPWRFFSIAIVFVVGALFYSDWVAFRQATFKANQTNELLQQTDKLLSSMKDAEAAERGYLLTGDRKYLDTLPRAEKDVPVELEALRRMAATVSPRNAPLIERIRTLATEKITQIRQTVDARDREGLDAALAIVRTDEGKLTMDELRSACSLLISGENYSFYQQTSASQALANRSRVIVLVGCLGLAFLLFRLGSAVDSVVAEREQFARSVEEARQLLETTVASIGDAVIVTDPEGRIRFMNRVAQRLTGWPAHQAEGRKLDAVFPVFRESEQGVNGEPLNVTGELLAGREPGQAARRESLVLRSRDGRALPVEESVAPIRGRGGKAMGLVLVFRDISERRAAERELERWKQIFSGAGFGMFLLDPEHDWAIVDMNATFAAMHGFSVSELRGKPLTALAAPEFRDGLEPVLRIAGVKGRHMFEQQQMRRDGTRFPALVDLTTFPDRNASADHGSWWAGYCSDITERKLFEDHLRESEERFRTLASALPQLVWSTDSQGRLEYANPVWLTYLGRQSLDASAETWGDFIHTEDREEFLDRWQRSLASGETFETQARLRRAEDGTYRWFLCRGVAVRDRQDRIIRWLGGCTDVQQQVESALQLKRANEALERSNSDLEQFAYAASHDLQEPLRMISIYTQLLKEEYGGALDEQAQSWIDFAVNGAQRMSNLLKALLAYSRVTSVALEDSAVSPADVAVRAALLNLSSVIEESGAQITVGALPQARLPEIHLVQLFQNLMGNAIKYRRRDQSGRPPRIHIDARPGLNGQWIFSVTDNGIGIEAEFLSQIFGVFKRLHGQNVEGTGIGLALCQKIVERAGGRIWAESEPGQGSTFYFTLPVVMSVEAATGVAG